MKVLCQQYIPIEDHYPIEVSIVMHQVIEQINQYQVLQVVVVLLLLVANL